MKLLYIAAPYRAKTICSLQQNIYDAKLMAMYYWKKGYAVICPHLNSANFDGLMPDQSFLQGTMLMLSKCDVIAMHPNWEQSSGCIKEHGFMAQKMMKAEMDLSDNRDTNHDIILYPDWYDILTLLDVFYREG